MNEIFIDIKNYEGLYQISNMGRVKSLPRKVKCYKGFTMTKEIYLKPFITKKYYLHVRLYNGIEKKDFSVHRLVAIHFILNPENKPEVNHIKSNKSDNRHFMLEWATSSENVIHSFKEGTSTKRKGTLNGMAKLNNEKVSEIKYKYLHYKIPFRELAKQYNVDYAVIQRIMAGTSWAHVK